MTIQTIWKADGVIFRNIERNVKLCKSIIKYPVCTESLSAYLNKFDVIVPEGCTYLFFRTDEFEFKLRFRGALCIIYITLLNHEDVQKTPF